jgi:WD40 repeat protein
VPRTLLASGGQDRVVRLWRVGGCLAPLLEDPLRGHGAPVTCLAFGDPGARPGRDDRDGDHPLLVCAGAADGTVRVWQLCGGAAMPLGDALVGHSLAVTSLALGTVGGRAVLATGGMDTTVRVWDVDVEHPSSGCRRLPGHAAGVVCVAFGQEVPGGPSVLLSAASDGVLRVWDDFVVRRDAHHATRAPRQVLDASWARVAGARGLLPHQVALLAHVVCCRTRLPC